MKKQFNLARELPKALAWLLEDKKTWQEQDPTREGHWSYVVATDLERRVRAAACEIADNVGYGTYGADSMFQSVHRVQIAVGGRLTLLDACRQFLFALVSAGKFRCFHPSPRKASASGMRFLPADAQLLKVEIKAQKEKSNAR